MEGNRKKKRREETTEETSEKSEVQEGKTRACIREGGYSLLGQKVVVGD